ncbi:hypothetical protein ES703_29624 [subsurface metagenome]
MRGLLIEFDLRTGERAGGINPRDNKLQCYGWQNLESKPALEIRVVEDDRDLSQYNGVPGVTILEDKAAINAAIQAHIPNRYSILDMTLVLAHVKEKGLSLDQFVGKNLNDIATWAFQNGISGVTESKPELLE